ncbi:MAG: UDP-N-acetylmuramate dehydrogenase [Gammaproteobacteria bacterium]|nr:UDP-N-acetylmuramate dehydrogenase [Gammaproteobacteria bacterium]
MPNTLGVPCVADAVRIVADAEALADNLREAEASGRPVTVVGGGSNLVLRSRLPGVVLLLRIRGLRVERLAASRWRVTAGAGEDWHEVVCATLGLGIGGLENLALIPGSVGAAPVQNIGAYGRELKDVLESVTVFDRRSGGLRELTVEDCGFGYRDSAFRRGGDASPAPIIVAVTMILGHRGLVTDYPDVTRALRRSGIRPSHWAIADVVTRVRRRKLPDPRRVGNVGSFFKNPVVTPGAFDRLRGKLSIEGYAVSDRIKVSAARLIDAAGWKGVAHGAVQVWPRQPLVLVNHGGATGADVLALARRIRDDVFAKYHVGLELEPTVLGTD